MKDIILGLLSILARLVAVIVGVFLLWGSFNSISGDPSEFNSPSGAGSLFGPLLGLFLVVGAFAPVPIWEIEEVRELGLMAVGVVVLILGVVFYSKLASDFIEKIFGPSFFASESFASTIAVFFCYGFGFAGTYMSMCWLGSLWDRLVGSNRTTPPDSMSR